MPIIKQNDYIDVIYDTICGFKLDEAIQILEKYRYKQLIPIEWLLKARNSYMIHDCPMSACAINEIINLWHICSEQEQKCDE